MICYLLSNKWVFNSTFEFFLLIGVKQSTAVSGIYEYQFSIYIWRGHLWNIKDLYLSRTCQCVRWKMTWSKMFQKRVEFFILLTKVNVIHSHNYKFWSVAIIWLKYCRYGVKNYPIKCSDTIQYNTAAVAQWVKAFAPQAEEWVLES